jgi:outer membrane protein TolC
MSQARVTLVQARAARYQDTVALYQALGGDWSSNQAQAEAQTAVPRP